MENPVLKYLDTLKITYQKYDHPMVATIAEAKEHWADIPGMHAKNLFLRDNKGKRHYLLCCEADKHIDLKALGARIGQRLGFASEQRLEKYLQLKPGSVSPFGLINDSDNHVQVFIDEDFRGASYLNFHPNINNSTIGIQVDDFEQYLDQVGNQWSYVSI